MKSRFHVKPGDVTPYSPANHTGTRNFRLIGRETVGGETFELAPGEACFFPADTPHVFTATSERARVMVIYAPPYEENPGKRRT